MADNNKVSWPVRHESVADLKKIILKILDSIPDKINGPGAEEANLHKVKAFYESCKDIASHRRLTGSQLTGQDELNRLGLKPLLPHIGTLVELFGEFDLIPSPDADDLVAAADWMGTYTESYAVSADLSQSADRFTALQKAKSIGGVQWDPTVEKTHLADEEMEHKPDASRREKLTKTLAWLNSRGESSLQFAS